MKLNNSTILSCISITVSCLLAGWVHGNACYHEGYQRAIMEHIKDMNQASTARLEGYELGVSHAKAYQSLGYSQGQLAELTEVNNQKLSHYAR